MRTTKLYQVPDEAEKISDPDSVNEILSYIGVDENSYEVLYVTWTEEVYKDYNEVWGLIGVAPFTCQPVDLLYKKEE